MIVTESPTLVRLRQKAESEETRLAGIDRELDGVQRRLDSYQRQADEADATSAQLKNRQWLNPVGFALTLGGASIVMLGAALGGGAPVMGAGLAVSLTGVGCFWASINSAQKGSRAAMDSAMARIGMITVGYDKTELEDKRHRQEQVASTAREAYESARQPLDMLQPAQGPAVDERGHSVVVGSVVVPKRDEP
jgi:hypothetical protein